MVFRTYDIEFSEEEKEQLYVVGDRIIKEIDKLYDGLLYKYKWIYNATDVSRELDSFISNYLWEITDKQKEQARVIKGYIRKHYRQ